MWDKTLAYKEILKSNIDECKKHLARLDSAFLNLSKFYSFPITENDIEEIVTDDRLIAFADQAVYRFAKLQDSMGAKLFKSLLLYQGETLDKPFIDLLNRLEKMGFLEVNDWFEVRDIRNEISHEYSSVHKSLAINMIFVAREKLREIIEKIEKIIG